ncbi:FG-nucleoporin nsp1 [Coemansia brasiliensis]|uniref:FG-nucleoporin nsp1 n=1 Tax=Coemansia brasiliensis TaxID=2650707 RepID=A0A9W8M191_9FUNG|nr:FG-nucleoporin nsp1 [Coemansia brasiliensis]
MFNAANGGNKGGGFSFGLGSSTSSGLGSQTTSSEAAKPATTFSFGGASTNTTGSLFGTAAASNESKPATGLSFGTGGGSGSLFGGGSTKPASTGFSFGTSAATGSSASSAAPSFGALAAGSSFGVKPAASGVASTTAAASAAPAFGGFKAPSGLSFGSTATPSTAAASTAATSAAATSAAPATGFGFGGAATPSTAGGSSKPLSFGTFGAKSSAAETKSETATTPAAVTNPTTGTGFGGFKLSTAPAVSSSEADADKDKKSEATATITSKPAATTCAAESKGENAADLANAALRGKTLEEIAQMWTAELTTQTRAFHTQANTVGYWDRALVQQGKRITELYEATMAVEAEQAALDQSLEHMEGQQSALQALLDTYEGRVQDIVHKTTAPKTNTRGGAMTADQERDLVYSSAERLNQQMEELARRLTTLVEDVNAISSASAATAEDGQQRAADPFAQIVEILNAHLTSLEWVDSQTSQLQDRLKNAERVYQDVVSTQSAVHGNLGDIGGSSADQLSQRDVLTIPGAFVNDPLPPVNSSFGTPMTSRKPVLTRTAAGAASSPFIGTPQRRGF